MIIDERTADKLIAKDGEQTLIVKVDDKRLMNEVITIDKLVREAWPYEQEYVKESIATNAPDFLQFKPEWCMLFPTLYWNCITELKKRDLY
jgi:hypothetical protein